MSQRVFLKLFLLIIVVVGVSTVALDLVVRRSWEASLCNLSSSRIFKTKFRCLLPAPIARRGQFPFSNWQTKLPSDARARATIIQREGKVLADSQADSESMENHATRPEFIGALQQDISAATRGPAIRWAFRFSTWLLRLRSVQCGWPIPWLPFAPTYTGYECSCSKHPASPCWRALSSR